MTECKLITVNEKSTVIFSANFTDEGGSPVTPSAISWSLTDALGTVVNGRQGVAVSPPSQSVDIVLTGDDLAINSAYIGNKRYLTIEATYSSSAGNDLKITEQVLFEIIDLVKIK